MKDLIFIVLFSLIFGFMACNTDKIKSDDMKEAEYISAATADKFTFRDERFSGRGSCFQNRERCKAGGKLQLARV